ncbi:Alkaline phosphatase synthesis transcriptional regulatory protein PhoP [hydrothermal vent metagenome]|uniref:Alkaline phosphatase synthesis transcriptional regulatory protein PhoP n=1 Tax=hydrothermal vent metagenome TaxID=652676 RepID=A0A3B0YQA4_9ZZZZ
MNNNPSILIVEDDETLSLVLADNLNEAGYQVQTADTGSKASQLLKNQQFDLIILDIMLPDTDGYSLCYSIRQAKIQAMILMLTARSLEDDIVKGFDAGADDYITKPYRLRELLSRVSALLRRQLPEESHFDFIPFTINKNSRQLFDENNSEVILTKKEFDLLEYLLQNRNRALTRTQILNTVWGEAIVVEERTVDNFVSNLKKKLNWTQQSTFRIVSIRGIGYRMEIDE